MLPALVGPGALAVGVAAGGGAGTTLAAEVPPATPPLNERGLAARAMTPPKAAQRPSSTRPSSQLESVVRIALSAISGGRPAPAGHGWDASPRDSREA